MKENFMLHFEINQQEVLFNHKRPVLLIGSCFSDEIAQKFLFAGFHVESNPLGTIFHPLPIARFLDFVCSTNDLPQGHQIEQNSTISSWEASTAFQFSTSKDLVDQLHQVKEIWNNRLSKASHLFITFGTAWGYEREEYGVVANCHKFPSSDFVKRLSDAVEIVSVFNSVLSNIQEVFPQLKVCLTVSPVRHIKDGLIDNNRSKAELIKAVHELVQAHENTCYFPSYELLIDVLRDYRFFKKDRIHPNEEAIDVVWNELLNAFAEEETKSIIDKVIRLRKMERHRPLTMNVQEIDQWRIKVENERSELLTSYPQLNLD